MDWSIDCSIDWLIVSVFLVLIQLTMADILTIFSEYKLQPSPAMTLRAMGGVLDFIICFGATPNDVIIEYTQTIGRPEIPPYWSLGLHESALVEDVETVVEKFHKSGLPLDVLHVRSRGMENAMQPIYPFSLTTQLFVCFFSTIIDW